MVTNLIRVLVMFDHEMESLVDGLRWMGFGRPRYVLVDVFYEIPH